MSFNVYLFFRSLEEKTGIEKKRKEGRKVKDWNDEILFFGLLFVG